MNKKDTPITRESPASQDSGTEASQILYFTLMQNFLLQNQDKLN